MNKKIVDNLLMGITTIIWMWVIGEFEINDIENEIENVTRQIKRNRGG
jgi:hypothetical protein